MYTRSINRHTRSALMAHCPDTTVPAGTLTAPFCPPAPRHDQPASLALPLFKPTPCPQTTVLSSVLSPAVSNVMLRCRFLLAGPTSTVKGNPNPAPDWLTDQSWSDIQYIAQHLPAFEVCVFVGICMGRAGYHVCNSRCFLLCRARSTSRTAFWRCSFCICLLPSETKRRSGLLCS